MEEARNITNLAVGQSEEQKRGYSGRTERDKKKVHFATLMDICHLKKSGVRTPITEV